MAEKKIVEMTIRVDVEGGIRLALTCEKCGKSEKQVPMAFDAFDRDMGRMDLESVFRVKSAVPAHGWDRVLGPDGFHVDVCGDCLRAWLTKGPVS